MTVSTTTTTPTGWAADAAYQNWMQAQSAINRPYEAYGGNMLAGFTPQQNAASNAVNAGQGWGLDALTQGQQAANAAAGYQAQQVTPGSVQAVGTGGAAGIGVTNTQAASAGPAALMQGASAGPASLMQGASAGPAALMRGAEFGRGDVRNVEAQNFLGANVGAYMNPYVDTVVNNSMRDLSRQNDIVNNTTNARAAAAGAFGGGRQAVANSLNNESFLRESGNLSGNLRNQGYNTAAQLIGQDQNRNLQAQQSNQGMDWNVGSMNTANQQAASLANINAANNMSQYNATNQQAAGLNNISQSNDMNRYNAGLQQQAGLNNITAANSMAQFNAGNQQQANQQTAAAHNAAANNYANASNSMAQYNASNQQAANQYNADLGLRAQLANQSAGQNAANLWQSAGNSLTGMGLDQQRFNLNNANALWGMGASQQAQDQAGLTNAAQQWQQAYNYPITQADQLRAALGGYNSGSASSQPYYANTAANVIGGGLGAAQLASQLPAAIGGISAGYNALSGLFGGGAPVSVASGMSPSGTLLRGVTGLLGGGV